MILLEGLNNFMKKDLENISQLYVESVLNLLESPDHVDVNGQVYNYDDLSLGNYTGILCDEGKFAISKNIVGHGLLIDALRKRELDNIITNIESNEFIKTIIKNGAYDEVRIWPKIKYYSFWLQTPTSFYTTSIENSLSAINESPDKYIFDFYSEVTLSFDQLKKLKLTKLDEDRIETAKRAKVENNELMALMKFNKKENTYGMEMEQPSFYAQKQRF
jgi:hypothetical protein